MKTSTVLWVGAAAVVAYLLYKKMTGPSALLTSSGNLFDNGLGLGGASGAS